MGILLSCSGCGRKMEAADSLAGRQAKCPACGASVVIPGRAPVALPVIDDPAWPRPCLGCSHAITPPPVAETSPFVPTITPRRTAAKPVDKLKPWPLEWLLAVPVVIATIYAIFVVPSLILVGLMFAALASPFLLCGWIGSLIADRKEAASQGFLASLFLGPIGWIVAAFLDGRHCCPACDERITRFAATESSVCPHCRSALVWTECGPRIEAPQG